MKQYYKHRLLFGYGGLGVSVLLFGAGLTGLYIGNNSEEYITVVTLLLLGLVFSTSYSGAGLDFSNKSTFKYFQILGLKITRKKQLYSCYSCILVLKYRTKWSYSSRATQGSRIEKGYTIILADRNHINKYNLAFFETLEQAKSTASIISNQIKLPIEQYSPPVKSQKR